MRKEEVIYDYVTEDKTHVWFPVKKLKTGDRIHRWGDELEVLNVRVRGGRVFITVDDSGKKETWSYEIRDELMKKV